MEKEIAALTDAFLLEWSDQLDLLAPLTVAAFPWGRHRAIGTLLAEIGDIRCFSSIKQLLSFLGWCPYTQQSGTKRAGRREMIHAILKTGQPYDRRRYPKHQPQAAN